MFFNRIPKASHTTSNSFQVVGELTVGSHGDESSSGEEQDEEHVAAEKEPPERGQVVEPGGCVSVQGLVEERLKVSLPPKRPNRPQTLQWDDEVREDRAPSCRGQQKHI